MKGEFYQLKISNIFRKKQIFVFSLLLFTTLLFGQFTDNSPGTRTWTAPAGVTSIVVEVWGAGGGGATTSGSPNARGGGSGGGYVRANYIVIPGNSYSYRVGSGGAANSNGQSSYFINTATINAVGGNGATSATGAAAPTTGNLPLLATVSTYGGNGGTAPSTTVSGGGGSSAGFTTGNNAVNRYGGYAPVYGYDGADGVNANSNGVAGKIGSGGSGGARNGGGSNRTGGAGGGGQIRISYCVAGAPSFTSTHSNLYISKFQFVGTLNNTAAITSTYSGTGYEDHTSVTPIAEQPQGAVMNVVAEIPSSIGTSGQGRWKAWVDWNNDGDFFDVGEEVYSMVNFYTPSVTFGFVIPASQPVGTYKLRIGTVRTSSYPSEYFGPCQIQSNIGEIEDYAFKVVADCPAKVASINDVNLFDGQRCGPGKVVLSATGNASAFDFKWYDSIYGGTLLGTGNTFLTPSISSTTTFYVSATTLGATCETPFRYPVEARIDPNPTVAFVTDPAPICGEEKPSVMVSASGDKYQEVYYEKFDSGLGVYTNTSAGSTFYDNLGNDISSWTNKLTPQVVPTDPPYEGLSPALSSGYFGGNFAMINSDINRTTNILNHLVSSNFDVNGFLNLTLEFDMYHFSIASNDTEGYVEVDYSLDGGTTWNPLTITIGADSMTKFYKNFGNPLNWQKISIPIPGSNFTTTQFKVRFSHFSKATTGPVFYEAITAVDNIRIFGFKAITTPFVWGSPTVSLYDTDCTTPVGSIPKSTVCVKPSATELESLNWTLNANATFSNGCPANGTIVINNNTKTWKQPGITDWNLGAQWKPNTVPDITKCIIVRTPVELSATTNGIGRNLIVKSGGNLTVRNGASLTIDKYIHNDSAPADFVVESDANLIQNDDVAINTGSFTVKRNANLKRLDYNYWGAPVTGQMLKAFSPNTNNNRFMTYNEADDYFYAVANPVTTAFTVGKGYAIRADNTYSPGVHVFNGQFVGGINNGVITTPINCTSCTPTSKGYNLIGNPYASNLDFAKLYTANSSLIYNTFYLWSNVNYNPPMQASNYPGSGIVNNYAVYTATGGLSAPYGFTGLGTNTPVAATPNQYLKVGQGFIVKAKAAGTLTFNNSMRTNNTTATFFNKGIADTPLDRFWLTLKTPLDFVTPLLLGYINGATNEYELDYDAELLTLGSDSFYSLLGTQKLAIQGRSYPFNNSEVIPLGAAFYQAGDYTIAIDKKEGIFENGQSIYLKDNLTGTITNLSETSYQFTTTTAGEVNNRFEIQYTTDGTLGTNNNTKNNILVYKQNNYFVIESPEIINIVRVYDASGSLITERKPNSKNTRIDTFKLQNGVYVIDIETTTKHYNKKVIK